MNFDGGRVKIEVRETLFCVFAGKFYRLCRAYILQRLWVQLFSNQDSAYLENFFEFTFEYAVDQHEKTFTGKNPRENASNIILLAESVVFSYVAQWSERLRGVQAVRVQASVEPNFFFRLFLFVWFLLFSSLGMFFLNSTAGPSVELHEVLWYTYFWVIRMIRSD